MVNNNPITIEVGQQYNNWLVLEPAIKGKVKCRCICGTERLVTKGNLGRVLGCGCVRKPYTKSQQPKPKKVQTNRVQLSRLTSAKKTAKANQSTDQPKVLTPTPAQQKQAQTRDKIFDILQEREFEKMYGELA